MRRRVLVTGSEDLGKSHLPNIYGDLRAQANIAGGLHNLTVIHGGCQTGADAWAHHFCEFFADVVEEVYEPEWETYGEAAVPVRNSVMIASGVDVCLAYPRGQGRGTMDCVGKAKASDIPVIFG